MKPREMEVDEFADFVRGVADRINNDPFTDALESCTDAVSGGFSQIFLEAESAAGEKWPPHAPATVAKHGPHPLLILSGIMLESVRQEGAVHNVKVVSERELSWGTSVEYAMAQNFGYEQNNLPAREFMYWTDEMADGCMDRLQAYIDEEILT